MASMGEDDVDGSIMKSKKKNKKLIRARMSTEGDANISNASGLNDSVNEMQNQSNLSLSPTEGSGLSKRKRKFNSSQQANLEISDDHKTESSPTKKKRKKNKSQIDDSKADISNVSDLADSVLDDSADVTFDGTSASNVSAISLSSNGSLKKKKKKKKKAQQLGGAGAPNQMNESTNNEEQMVIDGSPMKNKKKRKNKKKKLAQNGTATILDGSNASLGGQDESPNTEIEAEITDDTVNRKRKLSQGNVSTDNFADDESIDDPLDDSEEASMVDEGSKEKKKGNKFLEAKNKSEIKSPVLSKKEAKMLKKKNKKLKGIVPGLDTELELTKFSSKSDDVIDGEKDVKDEDDDDSVESDDDKGSFPRTPNKKFVPKEEESEERLDRTLFVGNLPMDVDQQKLKDLFKGLGKVESVRLRCAVPPKPSMSQKVANIKHEYHKDATSLKGFVVFEEKDDAEKALALNGTVFNGNHIRVDKAFGRKPRPENGKSPANNRGPQQQYDNKDTLFLGNLPYNVDDETLWNTFANCGNVKSVRVVRDNGTGIGKGFGFVQFEDSSGIDQALALDGTEVNGRPMRVKVSEKTRNDGPRNFQNQQNRSFGSGPPRKFGFNKFRGRGGGQDSGPRKTFKKMNNKRKMEQDKKKIAGMFKTDNS